MGIGLRVGSVCCARQEEQRQSVWLRCPVLLLSPVGRRCFRVAFFDVIAG